MLSLRLLAVSVAGVVIFGCASQPIVFQEKAVDQMPLPYNKIFVKDFTQDRRISINEVTWVNGWVPLFDGTRGPSPNKTLFNYLETAFKPGTSEEDSLRIALIHSDYLMEKNLADDAAFINFIAAQRERSYKCTASLSVSNREKSERKEFEVLEKKAGFLDMDWLQGFVTRCREKLVSDLHTYLKTF